jgi:hypothetical protein
MRETVEEISEKPEVREELARTAGKKAREKVKARATDKFWFVTHALLLVGCAIIYFLLGSKLIPFHNQMSILCAEFYVAPSS